MRALPLKSRERLAGAMQAGPGAGTWGGRQQPWCPVVPGAGSANKGEFGLEGHRAGGHGPGVKAVGISRAEEGGCWDSTSRAGLGKSAYGSPGE